jgi:protein-S-isoprenylcysteine O-methyltransferase Ste14
MNAIHSGLIPALWASWVAYWMLAAGNAKPNLRRESALSRLSHIAPLAIAIALFFPWSRTRGSWFLTPFMPQSIPGFWLGTALLAAGLGFTVWARLRLGRNWSGTVTLKQDHELIQSGPYRFVRHPIYTGLLTGFVGSALALGQWRGVVAVALVTIAFMRKISIEERWMLEMFGERYARYRQRVRALIPFVL